MKKSKTSEYIYDVDLEHESASYGIWNFKTFYDRSECMDYCESMAANNPDISISVRVRPRFRKRNALTAS